MRFDPGEDADLPPPALGIHKSMIQLEGAQEPAKCWIVPGSHGELEIGGRGQRRDTRGGVGLGAPEPSQLVLISATLAHPAIVESYRPALIEAVLDAAVAIRTQDGYRYIVC